ncbi:DNA-binding Lrp family transcriptional regulator [Nocardia sp. GAS34]
MSEGRADHTTVDEVDVMLLDALHANPRARFERLGPALGISAVTAVRRWQRLADSGRAWVSSVPGHHLALVAAVFEVRAQPGRAVEVADALCAVPQVASVYATDGTFDLHTLVFADDMVSLGELLLERLPGLPGIAMTRASVGLTWYSGVHWQLGAMDAAQKQSVTEPENQDRRRSVRNRTFDPAERALFLALQRDGRAHYRRLAQEIGATENLVRRRLDSMVRRGILSFRTDFARREGGWAAAYVFWLSCPHHQLGDIGDEIGGWPQIRICMSTVGPANLMVMSQVHRLADVGDILERLRCLTPQVSVVDQRLVLRAHKSWGRLLGPDGRAVDLVPVDPWHPMPALKGD